MALGTSFALSPIVIPSYKPIQNEVNYKMNLNLVYEESGMYKPGVDLKKDKWVIAFMSSSCCHCVVAGYKLFVLQKEMNELPLFLFINGDDQDIEKFHFKTKTSNIPYSKISSKNIISLAGNQFPAIFFIDNGVIVDRVSIFSLTEQKVTDWLKQN